MANAHIQALLSPPVARSTALLSNRNEPQGEYAYDEEPRSLLTDITGPVLGAVGAVGNFLDIPGSMLRDTLTGNNPFDQLLSPFSAEDRVSGRDMLTQWGLTNANKETGMGGWVDDPMEGVRDVGGFMAEVALDPLNMLSRPFKAAGTAADAARGTKAVAPAGRGLINNITDPLHFSELGEYWGLRSQLSSTGVREAGGEGLIRRGMQRTAKTMSGVADAMEKTKYVGSPFGAARAATGEAVSGANRVRKSLFDAATRGTIKALNQPLMRQLTKYTNLGMDIAKADAAAYESDMIDALKAAHTDDIMERLDEGSEVIDRIHNQATVDSMEMFEPIKARLDDLGYSSNEIDDVTESFSEAVSRTGGSTFNSLREWITQLKEGHVKRELSKIIDPGAEMGEEFFSKSGPKTDEMYRQLGWEKTPTGDLMMGNGDFHIIRSGENRKGNYFLYRGDDEILNTPSLAKTIQKAHEYIKGESASKASEAFQDYERGWMKSFLQHDQKVLKNLSEARQGSGFLDHYTLNQELRASAEGVDDYDFNLLTTPALHEVAQNLRTADSIVEKLAARGLKTGKYKEKGLGRELDHVTRRQGELSAAELKEVRGEGDKSLTGGARQLLESGLGSITHRAPHLTGNKLGTAGVNDMWRDPEILEAINQVNAQYMAGDYKGKMPSSSVDVSDMKDMLSATEIVGEGSLKGILDDLIDPRMQTVRMDDFAERLDELADRVGKQKGMRSVVRSDGKKSYGWEIGGQSRQYHVFDNLLAPDPHAAGFNKKNFRRHKESGEFVEKLVEPDTHDIIDWDDAIDEVKQYTGVGMSEGGRKRAIQKINEAREADVPVYAQMGKQGFQIKDLVVPRFKSTVEVSLRNKASFIRRKMDEGAEIGMDELKHLQHEQVAQHIRDFYGDTIVDKMPKYSESGRRLGRDFQLDDNEISKGGAEIRSSDDQFDEWKEKGLVTDDLDEAKKHNLIFEETESRIDKYIVPEMLKADGPYNSYQKHGVFSNSPYLDYIDGRNNLRMAEAKLDVFEKFIRHFIDRGKSYPQMKDPHLPVGNRTIGTLIGEQKTVLSENVFLEGVAKSIKPKLADEGAGKLLKEEVDRIKNIQIDDAEWVDFANGMDLGKHSLFDMDGGFGSALKFVDSMTRLFKVGVLAWPGRITRDATSASYRALESGMVDASRPLHAMKSMKMGHAVATGNFMPGFVDLLKKSRQYYDHGQDIQEKGVKYFRSDKNPSGYYEKHLRNPSEYSEEEAAFDFFRHEFYFSQGGAYHHTSMDMVDVLDDAKKLGTLKPLRESIPDFQGKGLMGHLWKTAKETMGDHGVGAINPINNRGVPHYLTSNPKLRGKVRSSTEFLPARLAEEAGGYTDGVTRAWATIDQMRRGETFRGAVDRAKATLVDYDPRRFSTFERDVMKRVFPFYSFLSSQIPYVMRELIRHPAGGLGMTIRAQRHAQDDKYVPFHMRDQAAIPGGVDAEGNQTYISSLGLMHEDAVAMLKTDLADIFGNMNPLLKAPVELATGRSLFMRGPTGGRELSELDPAVGRILKRSKEITGLADPDDRRPAPFIGLRTEHILSNSPAARLLSTTRTLLDNRKSWWQKGVNLLLGPKYTTISPQQQHSMMQSEVDAIFKEMGVRPFTKYAMRKGEIEAIEASGDKATAYRLRASVKLRAIMDKAQKERNK